VQYGAADVGAVELFSAIPIAVAAAADVTTAGGTIHTITVQYFDDVGINTATLGNSDITVNGPGGPIPTTFTGFTISGTSVTATYNIVPPGDSWDDGDNGKYLITMNANEMSDTDGAPHSVPAGTIGSFTVAISKTFVVNATNDETTDSDGKTSLREAILLANQFAGTVDTVAFDPAVFGSPQTILLTLGELAITTSVAIQGPGAGLLTINADAKSRHFKIDSQTTGSITVPISGMTLTNGTSGTSNGGSVLIGNAAVTLSKMILTGNKAEGTTGNGGAIALDAQTSDVTILDSTISGNSATSAGGEGGGIDVNSTGKLTLFRCNVSGNTAARNGAGIYFFAGGTLIMDDSTVSGNKANTLTAGAGGGGIYLFNTTATIRNTTVSGNSATNGGGIGIFSGTATTLIQNSTIAFNTATTAGGGITRPATAVVTIESSVVSDNTAPTGPDINGTISTMNVSLVGNSAGLTITSSSGNLLDVAAKLGPLANNGGPTLTHALLPGSPALNAGSNSASLTTDQRGAGFVRVSGAAADIGAFEFQQVKVSSVIVNGGDKQRSRVTKLDVTFDSAIALPANAADAFQLKRQGNDLPVNLIASVNGNVVTLTFTGGAVDGPSNSFSLIDGRYTLTVLANQVNTGGLDGDGNGTTGDNFVLIGDPAVAPKLFRLFGDADGNGLIDLLDFAQFRTAFNPSFAAMFDFDGSGTVDLLDFNQFRSRFQTQV
jgi:CSLREA domain-containing protein